MFKITCMKCGKETIFKQGEEYYRFDKDNKDIDVRGIGYDGNVEVGCTCGNIIDDEYGKGVEPSEPIKLEPLKQTFNPALYVNMYKQGKGNYTKEMKEAIEEYIKSKEE